MSTKSPPLRFTDKQGQYLAFIHTYGVLNGRAPAETDMQRYFRVTPPSVHSMVLKLERCGLIRRTPRQARSIELAVAAGDLPPLRPQPIKTSVAGY
jgi:DNA-binding MarR family transcriptional regulator